MSTKNAKEKSSALKTKILAVKKKRLSSADSESGSSSTLKGSLCSRANWEQDTYPGGAGRRLTNIMDEHPIYPGAPL